MAGPKNRYINRELSWLSFNGRVLQEAADPRVPLIERIKFLGIYSNNMDEFFRVRVATLKRLSDLGRTSERVIGGTPRQVLAQIQEKVLTLRHRFDSIYQQIRSELEEEHIYIVNETQLAGEQGAFVKEYFNTRVRPTLVPVMLDYAPQSPMVRDKMIYLAILLKDIVKSSRERHALIELPTDKLSRFLVLPSPPGEHHIMLLDDVVRYNLADIFGTFDFDSIEAYTIKMTRDAELDIDDDVSEPMLQKIGKSLKQRRKGRPVRFIYDEAMPPSLLSYIIKGLGLRKGDNVLPGQRYHNFKDFMKFPAVGPDYLRYPPKPPLPHPLLQNAKSLFPVIKKQDVLLHYPYQSFNHMIDLLREAAIDPGVEQIKMTLYRVAEDSNIINALINAVQNGKQVTVVVELQARFDEENNIYWSNRLREGGARVLFGVPGMKVHAKLVLIYRKERGKSVRYVHIGTGNFHEKTARLYSDHALLTAHPETTAEVANVFTFFENSLRQGSYKHLLVSPFLMRNRLNSLISKEIENARLGRPAYMVLKMNSLVDVQLIDRLYEASAAGVKIRLIVRGICSLIAGVEGLSENIEAISIVDKYLEHSRVFLFANGGDELVFISSADWMTRNLDHRVEVAAPILNPELKQQLKDFLSIQWADNVKARTLNSAQANEYVPQHGQQPLRAQEDYYSYLKTIGQKPEVQEAWGLRPKTGDSKPLP